MRFMQRRSEEEKDYYPGTPCERDSIASGVNVIHHQYLIGISLGFTWYWIGDEISCISPLIDGPLS